MSYEALMRAREVGVAAVVVGGFDDQDLRQLLGRDLGGRTADTSMELAGLLLEEIKIAVVPGEAFGAPGYLRFSFALSDEDLEEGLGRLQALVGG